MGTLLCAQKKQAVHVCHNLSEKQKNEGKRKRGKGEKNVLRMRKRRRTNEE
jgi:retron-type reverse transcriptase